MVLPLKDLINHNNIECGDNTALWTRMRINIETKCMHLLRPNIASFHKSIAIICNFLAIFVLAPLLYPDRPVAQLLSMARRYCQQHV